MGENSMRRLSVLPRQATTESNGDQLGINHKAPAAVEHASSENGLAGLTSEQKVALDFARHLAVFGVPLFVAKPSSKSKMGYALPKHWERKKADPAVVDEWEPGMALCAVMGHAVDAVDLDPRSGGTEESLAAALANQPTAYGVQSTPSGGKHLFVASMGVRSRDGVLPGIDVKAGDADGNGRGFVFLAPTERVSKVTGEITPYRWVEDPDIEMVSILGDDGTTADLAALVAASRTPDFTGPAYDGPSYADLPQSERDLADRDTDAFLGGWRSKLATAATWDEGERDAKGRGWETLAYQFAWALARHAFAPWTRLNIDEAEDIYNEILPEELHSSDACQDKWIPSMLRRAANLPAEAPSWAMLGDLTVDGSDKAGADSRSKVDVTDETVALTWLKTEVGQGKLSSVMRRGGVAVHVPAMGEDGYLAGDAGDGAESAPIESLDRERLAARVDHHYRVIAKTAKGYKSQLFPSSVAHRALAVPEYLVNLREIRSVSHTPIMRKEGTVLAEPGYDVETGVLYLPHAGLKVPPVSDEPTREEVQKAGKLLLKMIADFPFVTPHDRANYLGALLTPILRQIVPPPYQLIAISAPQRGSGKTLLASIARQLHGGVFKAEFPNNEEERRKMFTSVLSTTSAPVVQFDNVTGTIRSSTLDGLLTSRRWSDRVLGRSEMVDLDNDRLWMLTGNNIHIGGDLERRTLWVTINANLERPETREASGFEIPNLEHWVTEHRGEILHALLTLVRAWVVAGRKTGAAPSSDQFGTWIATLRGILTHADLGDEVGVVAHQDTKPEVVDAEAVELAAFLAAARRTFGKHPWTAAELLYECGVGRPIDDDELPSRVDGKDRSKSLGRYLGYARQRWADGLCVVSSGSSSRAKKWRVYTHEEAGLAEIVGDVVSATDAAEKAEQMKAARREAAEGHAERRALSAAAEFDDTISDDPEEAGKTAVAP